MKTSYFRICFDEHDGAVTSLKSGSKEFIHTVLPLFSFQLRNGGETHVFSSDMARIIDISVNDDMYTGSYSGFDGFDISFEACAKVAENGKGLVWSVSYLNRTGSCVEWINYPQIAVPNDLVRNGGSGRVVTNFNEGLLVEDMDLRQKTMPYREPKYPGHGMYGLFPAVVESPFLAYYDDAKGLYLGAHDKKRALKGIDFLPVNHNKSIKLQIRVYPGQFASKEKYALTYPIVLELFDGDWQDACEIYRSWFEQNLPEGLLPIKEDKSLSEWYTDSPLIVTYPVQGVHDMDTPVPNRLFPYENALGTLDSIAEETGARVMALLMHWEGTAPWCPPYVWPPLGGVDCFKNFADKLHERSFLLGVYCSGIGYTLHSNLNDYSMEDEYEKEGIERFMCAPADAGKPVSDICQAIRKSLDMCIAEDFTKDIIANEVAKMKGSGIDYIQVLDQNHGGTPYFCYSDKHGHPPVPGAWMVDNMKELLERLTADQDSPIYGCESAAAEAYVPYLKLSDNRFNLNYNCGRPVPVYSYIYHEYLNNFSGNSVCSMDIIDINRSPDCHLMRIAYSFVNGDLMTLVITQDGEVAWSWGERDFSVLPERTPMMKFIKTATAFRRGAGKKFLVGGKMMKNIKTVCENVKMYRAQNPDYYTEYPAVLSATYDAFDGTTGTFLANYTKKDVESRITLPKDGAIVDCDGTVIEKCKEGELTLNVPAASVILVTY